MFLAVYRADINPVFRVAAQRHVLGDEVARKSWVNFCIHKVIARSETSLQRVVLFMVLQRSIDELIVVSFGKQDG